MSSLGSAQKTGLRYVLAMPKPADHLLEVSVRVAVAEGRFVDFRLPVWRPGRYVVLDFAGGVQEFSADDGHGSPLKWEKTDKATWRVTTDGVRDVRVRYKVYANEFNLRTRGLDEDHAFIDGTAVFMYTEEARPFPVELEVVPYDGWHVTTGLEGNGLRYTASDYDHLVDCPLEIGTQQDIEFSVDGVPHVLSIAGKGNWRRDSLIQGISRIVKVQKDFFGEFPYRRYVFLLHLTPGGGGGTEHANSTIMGVHPLAFDDPQGLRRFHGLVSHEYFHTWNVKSFRPKGLTPYDYSRENYTQELWIAEGTTSYYDDLMLVRAGLLSEEKYLEALAQWVERDRQRPGNVIQPLSASSFDAWVKYWRATEQAVNAESDFYAKGACVSFLLDLEIRRRSANAASLDDAMRMMFRDYPPSGPGYTTDDFRRGAEQCAGGSLKQFFDDYVDGTTPLPWEEALDVAGLVLAPKDTARRPWIGVIPSEAGDRTRINGVVAGSPAEDAGISVGDVLVALDGLRVRGPELADRLRSYPEGSKATITVFRNDRLRECRVTVGSASVPAYTVTPHKAPSELQLAVYRSWLGGK